MDCGAVVISEEAAERRHIQPPAMMHRKSAEWCIESLDGSLIAPVPTAGMGAMVGSITLLCVSTYPPDGQGRHERAIQLAAQSIIMCTRGATAPHEVGQRRQPRACQGIHQAAGCEGRRSRAASIEDHDPLPCARKLERQQGASEATPDDEGVDATGGGMHQDRLGTSRRSGGSGCPARLRRRTGHGASAPSVRAATISSGMRPQSDTFTSSSTEMIHV